MRWDLLRVFDTIYVMDLHGNTNKKEKAPDGSADKNVFDIMQGVSIIICARKSDKSKGLAVVKHSEIWGSRQHKNEILGTTRIISADWSTLTPSAPRFAFVPTNDDLSEEYSNGFAVNQLFNILGNGIVTKRDRLCVQSTADEVWQSMLAFRDDPEGAVRSRYAIPDDVRDWKYEWAKTDIVTHMDQSYIREINYRPFDPRFMVYTGNARGFVGWPVKQVMSHYLEGPNIGLLVPKANRDAQFSHAFVTERPSEAIFLSSTTGSNAMNLPLYLYPDADAPQSDAFAAKCRTLNFTPKLYAAICRSAKIDPSRQAGPDDDFRAATGDARPSEVKVFDYIYGILHSQDYRSMYAEFLKLDFPHIPYPSSPEVFRSISGNGEALRRLHLMEADAIGDTPYPYHGEGNDVVAGGYPKFESGCVHINSNQYFDAVPEVAWSFFIGGYQPAQKWLKDRRGRSLSWDEIRQYQAIIKILAETDRIMREIERPAA